MGTRAINKANDDHHIVWCRSTAKWRVKIVRGGRTHEVGRFVDRPSARAARDAFLASLGVEPQVEPRHLNGDAKLRATALRAARVQFTAASPLDLIKAAEQLYLWLKHGDTGVGDAAICPTNAAQPRSDNATTH